MKEASIHLRVKDGGRCLDYGDGLVVDLLGENVALAVLEDGTKVEGEVLGVHLGREAVGQRLLLAGGDGQVVAGRAEVAENDRRVWSTWHTDGRHQRTTDQNQGNWLGLEVGDAENGLGCVAIDELDAKDLAVGERCRDGDGKRRAGAGRINLLLPIGRNLFE